MKLFATIFPLFLLLFLASCGTDPYNVGETEKQRDRNEGNEYVYGDGKGKPARQTKNTYTDTPEGEKRALALREKMFKEGKAVQQENTILQADSAKKDTLKTEKKEESKKEAKK